MKGKKVDLYLYYGNLVRNVLPTLDNNVLDLRILYFKLISVLSRVSRAPKVWQM